MKLQSITTVLAACALCAALGGQAVADPLVGEVLKFQQLPLNNGQGPSLGGAPYPGHDEWSTAYPSPAVGAYIGEFMADDFADTVSEPVVHVRWWGSYDQNQTFNGVRRFLISFESDLPFDPLIGASRPDQPLLNQIVTRNPLAPGSGTFSEKLINGAVPEHLFEYNAELKVPFAEKANTVYWLKIVALVDPATEGSIHWGWHDRDWGIQDTLASVLPAVSPGEGIIGSVPDSTGNPTPVWHFQDDAVSGLVSIQPNAGGSPIITQANYKPQNYIFQTPGAIFVDGPPQIQNFSKDLAFELYYRPIPEPSTLALLGIAVGGLGLLIWKRRRMGAAGAGAASLGAALLVLTLSSEAYAVLGGFETIDGYATPFPRDVWMYDAGQTGAPFIPIQYNTGRWQELFGSGNAGGDAQYISQHGYGGGGANVAPFALAVRAISPSTNGSYDMTLRYGTGVDDLGIAPNTTLMSAVIDFDLCPGATIISGAGLDTVFNNVPAFTLSFAGTNAAPGATIGFSDNDPANAFRTQFVHYNGNAYQSQVVSWSGRFDHVQVNLDFTNSTFDVLQTKDFNLITPEFDPGNLPQIIATGAAMTNPVSMLDSMYFRTHTDPSTGLTIAGLEKSFLDNFRFSVKPVPEPSTLTLAAVGLLGLGWCAVRRRRTAACVKGQPTK